MQEPVKNETPREKKGRLRTHIETGAATRMTPTAGPIPCLLVRLPSRRKQYLNLPIGHVLSPWQMKESYVMRAKPKHI